VALVGSSSVVDRSKMNMLQSKSKQSKKAAGKKDKDPLSPEKTKEGSPKDEEKLTKVLLPLLFSFTRRDNGQFAVYL